MGVEVSKSVRLLGEVCVRITEAVRALKAFLL